MHPWKRIIEKDINAWAWVIWGTLALSFIVVYFHRVALAVVMDYLMVDLEITEGAVAGTLAGIYSIIYFVMQVPAGLLADFWGPRKTSSAGMLVAALGSIIFALAPAASAAFIGRAVVGIGVSVIYISVLKFQTSWFRAAQFGTLTGLTVFMGNLGGAMGTSPLAYLVEGFGWRGSFFIAGLITLGIALLCWLLVRDTPEDFLGSSGSLKYPVEKKSWDNWDNKKEQVAELWKALKDVFKNRRTWPLFISMFGVYGTLIAFSGAWSISYLMQVYGLSRGEAANYMLAVTVGMMVGCPLVGIISDWMRRRKAPHLVFFAAYIVLWVILFAWGAGKPPQIMLYHLFFLMGLFGSTVVTVFGSAKEVNPPAYSGVAMGIVNMGGFAGISVLQPLLGFVLDLHWEGEMIGGARVYPLEAYQMLFLSCLLVLAFCFLCALFIKETRCQNVFNAGHEAGKYSDRFIKK